ncbi:hypothetical protein F3Y22_tig00002840pilonHSYRG00903 [Hibiscus syriacus]|uniref:Reverse transcriptase zinc-binding domain-containing protein n=1 Tax=Hibiscus syriacus TaxID=106335 RepID=A0A6A3CQ29_HIBSY|nr:hypothetical protein F3Y22_tig00002840pilonHSYRG00903 [Hibiscus syriacus]
MAATTGMPCVVSCHMVTVDGAWDIESLSNLLSHVAIPHIMNIKPPETFDGLDVCTWRWNPTSTFATNSAYQWLLDRNWDDENKNWDFIWKLQIPQRIRFFLWLALLMACS